MVTEERLNVTLIEPRFKHSTIFKYFDALKEGESFIIENDHDPKPLYYQLLGERGDIFTWEYMSAGPEWWFVKLSKKQKGDETIGEIAAKDYRKAEVFKKLGIDFCCGGRKTLQEASKEAGISEEDLSSALESAELQANNKVKNYNEWQPGFLADYIVNTHHSYIKNNTEVINEVAQKVAAHHGTNHPELINLAFRITKFLNGMISHMQKEEKVLFPYIKLLEGVKNGTVSSEDIPNGSIVAPIRMMMGEHELSREDLNFFRTTTNNYTLPPDACNSYSYLFEKMQEFESDLKEHFHVENNILFPKAIQMEKDLKV